MKKYLRKARSTSEVPAADQSTQLPYRQTYQFNAFNNLTQRNNRHWGTETWLGQSNNLSYTYKNNRVQGQGWLYDADGRTLQTSLPDDFASSVYNASGQMARSSSSYTDAARWYNGDGREIKRVTANLVETQTTANWVMQPIKYFIRSSVLGGETVSEVWANGKKGKTFVRAAGAKIAYQSAYSSDTAALNEAVYFEYSDASGMTQRTTDRTGFAVYGDGGEGSPVEADPMGGNVGTETPYVEQIQPWIPPAEFPDFLPVFDDSPIYVNGQRLTCILDGMAVGCPFAFSRLGSSAEIDFRNTDPFLLGQLGIMAVPVYGTRDVSPTDPNTPNDPNAPIVIRTAEERYFIGWDYFFNISWAPQLQNRTPVDTPQDKLLKRARELHEKTDRNDCLSLVELFQYAGEIFSNVNGATNALADVVGDGDFLRLAIDNAAQSIDYTTRRDPPVGFFGTGFKSNPDLRGNHLSNQVRHFMAGFIIAASLGAGRALELMNSNELTNSPDDNADRRLNAISTELGGLVQPHNSKYLRASGPHTAEFMNGIADQIRSRVCE